MKILIIAAIIATACASSPFVHQTGGSIDDNISNAFVKYGKCFEDKRGLKSFLIGLKYQPGGKKMVDAFVAFETAMSREVQAIHKIPHADVILKELKTLLTSNMPTDKRMVHLENLVNFDCLLETTLDLLENNTSFQNFVTFLSRPEQVKAFKHLEASTEARNLAQLLRRAGLEVDVIAEIFHDVLIIKRMPMVTQVQQFASSSFKAFNCSNCPGCTACLQCCILKNHM